MHIFMCMCNMCEHIVSEHARDLWDTACQHIPEGLMGARSLAGKFYLHCKRHSRFQHMSLV